MSACFACTALFVSKLNGSTFKCAQNGVVFGNGKAANAGGVAVSGLEMSQNRIGERRMLFAWLFAAELKSVQLPSWLQ